MRTRVALLLAFLATPAWAHGEQLVLYFGAIFFVLPGALVLLVPWHLLGVRFVTALAYALVAFGIWKLMFAAAGTGMTAVLQWLIILTPAMFAAIVPLMVRVLYPRE